mmetsp:Transcript_57715/g.140968  ORF Transcript_57715/g.140968 Transcript_57715/m.140968 type:complete len:84 (-) Transcript_57715:1004-1255(-)
MMMMDTLMMMILFLMSLGAVLLPTGYGRFVGAFMIQSSRSVTPSRDHHRTTNDGINMSPPSLSDVCLHLSRRDEDSDGDHISD